VRRLPPPLDRADPSSWVDAGSKWDSSGEQGSGWGGTTATALHSDIGGGRESPSLIESGGARTPEGLPTTRMLDDFRSVRRPTRPP